MDDEIKQNLIRYEAIKQKVFTAFADVTLGDGIGFYEANAIDDHVSPTSGEYLKEKALDERFDFRKVFDFIEKFDDYPSQIHCFMDFKVLHFYLPVLLLLFDEDYKQIFFENLVSKEKQDYIDLMSLLTVDQKKCIIEIAKYDYDNQINFYINFKGHKCNSCGKIHHPKNYSFEEAKALVDSAAEYNVVEYLEKHLSL